MYHGPHKERISLLSSQFLNIEPMPCIYTNNWSKIHNEHCCTCYIHFVVTALLNIERNLYMSWAIDKRDINFCKTAEEKSLQNHLSRDRHCILLG